MCEPSPNKPQRLPQLSSHGITQDPSSAPSSASVQSPLSPGSRLNNASTSSRPSSGLGGRQYHPFQLPGAGARHATYPQHYYPPPMAQAHGSTLPRYNDISHAHNPYGDSAGMPIIAHLPGQQGQKRAYRQRRKDPSCDACRERKVKVRAPVLFIPYNCLVTLSAMQPIARRVPNAKVGASRVNLPRKQTGG